MGLVVIIAGGGGIAYYNGLFEKEKEEKIGLVENKTKYTNNEKEKEKIEIIVEQKRIPVTIMTKPEGAVVEIEGLGQVCSKTPCKVELEEGKSVKIRASYKNETEKMTFTPFDQNKELLLEFKKVATKKNEKTIRKNEKKNNEKRSNEKKNSELKIPGIFKDN